MHYKTLNYLIDPYALTVTTTTGEAIAIRPKTCQLLLVLLENKGNPIHKAEFLKQVWPNSVVEEQVIFQSVKEIRQLFSPQEVIKTIPKQGYLWLPEVEKLFTNTKPQTSPLNPHWIFNYKKVMVAILLLLLSLSFIFNHHSEKQQLSNEYKDIQQGITGSVVILPTTNNIQGNDHSWVRLGLMDQLIQRLPRDKQYGILQTDYVLEVLERANAPLMKIKAEHIQEIFHVSGANLIVATKLTGSPFDYQLSYTLYRPDIKQQGIFFASNIQALVDQLSHLLATLLGNKTSLNAQQYHADFTHQMLGVAIDFRLEGKHKAAIGLLTSIVENNTKNFTAQRLLIESFLALGKLKKAGQQLITVMPTAQQYAQPEELTRILYLNAIYNLISGNQASAHQYIMKALKIAQENYDWLYQAYITNLQAEIAMKEGDFEQAKALFYQAMKYHKVLKCPLGESVSWVNLATLAEKQNQVQQKNAALEKALSIAKARNLTKQMAFVKQLMKAK